MNTGALSHTYVTPTLGGTTTVNRLDADKKSAKNSRAKQPKKPYACKHGRETILEHFEHTYPDFFIHSEPGTLIIPGLDKTAKDPKEETEEYKRLYDDYEVALHEVFEADDAEETSPEEYAAKVAAFKATSAALGEYMGRAPEMVEAEAADMAETETALLIRDFNHPHEDYYDAKTLKEKQAFVAEADEAWALRVVNSMSKGKLMRSCFTLKGVLSELQHGTLDPRYVLKGGWEALHALLLLGVAQVQKTPLNCRGAESTCPYVWEKLTPIFERRGEERVLFVTKWLLLSLYTSDIIPGELFDEDWEVIRTLVWFGWLSKTFSDAFPTAATPA